jgi:hypothetical protein
MPNNLGEIGKQTWWSRAVILVLCVTVGAVLAAALCGRCFAQDIQNTGGPVEMPPATPRCRTCSAQATENVDDITGRYQFLSADDTLGILEEEGKLKGYIEVLPGGDESEIELTYEIISGSRKNGHVEFKTNTIHRRYYRFSGKVERGSGQKPDEPDYLRLIGDVETVTIKGDSGQESVQRTHLILKSLGKSEGEEE